MLGVFMTKKHGGTRGGAGRKAISTDSPTVCVSVKMTQLQRAAYLQNGGAAWMREMIDEQLARSEN